jgi:hypothetical protein
MTREELEEQFAIECTTLDEEGYTVVKGTPMDIINWIADKFRLSDVMESVCHCINWHPSTKANEGKKAVCSHCKRPRQTVT